MIGCLLYIMLMWLSVVWRNIFLIFLIYYVIPFLCQHLKKKSISKNLLFVRTFITLIFSSETSTATCLLGVVMKLKNYLQVGPLIIIEWKLLIHSMKYSIANIKNLWNKNDLKWILILIWFVFECILKHTCLHYTT